MVYVCDMYYMCGVCMCVHVCAVYAFLFWKQINSMFCECASYVHAGPEYAFCCVVHVCDVWVCSKWGCVVCVWYVGVCIYVCGMWVCVDVVYVWVCAWCLWYTCVCECLWCVVYVYVNVVCVGGVCVRYVSVVYLHGLSLCVVCRSIYQQGV